MNIILKLREKRHVEQFWRESKDEELQRMFPFMKNTLEEAVELYEKSLKLDSTSYGKTIYVENEYIGDVWCYCIDEEKEKSCFLSIVIFNKEYWGMGIGKKAINSFMEEVLQKYRIKKVCAFTYKSNIASAKTLEKCGFEQLEEFVEDGVESLYFEKVIA